MSHSRLYTLPSSHSKQDMNFFNRILEQLEALQFNKNDFVTYRERYSGFFDRFNQKQLSTKDVFLLLEEMLNEGFYPNAYIVSKILQILNKNKANYFILKGIFTDAENRAIVDSYIYYGIIISAIQNDDKDLAKEKFNTAENQNFIDAKMLNVIINYMGKNQDYAYAKEKFNNARRKWVDAKGKNLVDTILYGVMIKIAIDGQYQDAKDFFDEAEQLGLIDSVSLAMLLNAAGKNKEYEYARRKYNNALIKKWDAKGELLVDSIVFQIMVHIAIANEELKDAKYYYDEMEENELTDATSLGEILNATGKNKDYVYARSKYNNALIKKWDKSGKPLIDPVICNSIIQIAILNNEIADAKYYFDEIEENNLTESLSLNLILDAAGKNNNYQYAISKYKNALIKKYDASKNPLIDGITYATLTNIALLNNEIDDARIFFEKLERKDIEFGVTILDLVIRKIGDPMLIPKTISVAESDYHYAKEKFYKYFNEGKIKKHASGQPLIDKSVVRSMIDIAILNAKVEDAKDCFNQAENLNLVDMELLIIIMDLANENNDYAYAKEKFLNALNNGKIKFDTKLNLSIAERLFSSIIYGAISKRKYVMDAQLYFNTAESLGITLYSLLRPIIIMAIKYEDYYAYVKEKFDTVFKNHNGTPTGVYENELPIEFILFHSMLKAAVLNGQIEDAEQYLSQARQLKIIIDTNDLEVREIGHNNYEIDLHDHYYGETYLKLKKIIESKALPLKLTIICGINRKKVPEGEENALKKATNQILKEMEETAEVTYIPNERNKGQIKCKIAPLSITLQKRARENDNEMEPAQKKQKLLNGQIKALRNARQLKQTFIKDCENPITASIRREVCHLASVVSQVAAGHVAVIENMSQDINSATNWYHTEYKLK